jgi:polyhydroxybutyrate depolymerase
MPPRSAAHRSGLPAIGTIARTGRLQAGLRSWYRKLGCKPGAAAAVDPGKTVHRTIARCADRSEVVSYVITGMGHSWPGGTDEGLGDPDTKINAVDVMWAVFKAHPRRA